MNKKVKPLEVKKLEDGSLSVRWSTSPTEWATITDKVMIAFIIWRMVDGD
jgi:hypothetical protein